MHHLVTIIAHEASNQSSPNLSIALIFIKSGVSLSSRRSNKCSPPKRMPLAQRASNCTILQRKVLVYSLSIPLFLKQVSKIELTSWFALYTRYDDRSPGTGGTSFVAG
jgi:hypothetical protein